MPSAKSVLAPAAVTVIVAYFAAVHWVTVMSVFIPPSLWKLFLPGSTVACPTLDYGAYESKLLKVQEINVSSHEECVAHGQALQLPLICNGNVLNEDETIMHILDDPTNYRLQCYDLEHSLKSLVNLSPQSGLNSTLAKMLEENPNCYAGIIYGDAHQEQLRKIFTHLDEKMDPKKSIQAGKTAHFGTSFLSQFPDNEVSAADHAALVESMVYQLVGSKIFVLHKRKQSSNNYLFLGGTFVPYPVCASDFVDGIDQFYVATVRPGAYLYFPFSWEHTVYTKAGLNIMTNIRMISFDLVRTLSWHELFAVVVSRVTLKFTGEKLSGNPRFVTEKMRFTQSAYDLYDDSASTSVAKSALDKFW